MKTRIVLGLALLAIAGYAITACVEDEVYVGPPTIENVLRMPLAPESIDDVTISADISDLKGIKSAKLYYKSSAMGDFTGIDMTKGTAPAYSAVIPAQPLNEVVTYYLEAVNTSNLKTLYPANAPTSAQSYTVGAPAIVMNEIFSRGVAGNEDWIELYNSSGTPVDISGYRVYDSGGQGGSKPKMLVPNGTTIAAKGYYVITVDNAATALPEGSSFGISSGGEEIWLENAAGVEIDHQAVPAMPVATTSYGRTTDGGATWEILTTVTKNAPNSALAPAITGLAITPTAPSATNVVKVSATVTDAGSLASVKLYYKVGTGAYSDVSMTNTGDLYSANIPAQAAGSVVSYYIEATNSASLTSYAPASAPATPASYTVSSLSSITGMAISPAVPTPSDAVAVSATITDVQGVTAAELHYKVNSGSYTTVAMTNAGDLYSGSIPAQPAGDVVSYYIKVTNASNLVTYSPADAPAAPATYTVAGTPTVGNLAKSPASPTSLDQVTVSADVTGVIPTGTVKLYYRVGTGSFTSIDMTKGAGNSYSASVPQQPAPSVVSYYIEAQNSPSLTATLPTSGTLAPDSYSVLGPLVLNEVCGKQAPDDDWIEIHNSTMQTVDIGGFKLIKDGGATPMWTAAAGKTIPAGGYAIVPTQPGSDTGYGVLTAGISNTKAVKLELKTSTGIVLSLLDKTASNLGGASGHPENGSYARVPNATGEWSVQATNTKGVANPTSK